MFLDMIKTFTSEAVGTIKEDQSGFGGLSFSKESVGKCPLCGSDIIETERAFGCSNWKSGCKYTIWKNDKYIAALGKDVTRPMVEILLKNGKVGFKNLKSKKGTTFAAYLFYEKNEQNGYFNWRMEFI